MYICTYSMYPDVPSVKICLDTQDNQLPENKKTLLLFNSYFEKFSRTKQCPVSDHVPNSLVSPATPINLKKSKDVASKFLVFSAFILGNKQKPTTRMKITRESRDGSAKSVETGTEVIAECILCCIVCSNCIILCMYLHVCPVAHAWYGCYPLSTLLTGFYILDYHEVFRYIM